MFYILQDSVRLLSGPVYRHTLGSGPKAEVKVYDEADKTLFVRLGNGAARRLVIIRSAASTPPRAGRAKPTAAGAGAGGVQACAEVRFRSAADSQFEGPSTSGLGNCCHSAAESERQQLLRYSQAQGRKRPIAGPGRRV